MLYVTAQYLGRKPLFGTLKLTAYQILMFSASAQSSVTYIFSQVESKGDKVGMASPVARI